MSVSEQIQALEASRQAIAAAITQKGGTVAQGDGFSQFAAEISNLPSGGETGNPLLKSIDVDDFTGTTFNRTANYITDVTIPSGVTELGYEAFYQCVRLTSITLPNTLNRISQRAFMGCSSLQTINIPNSVATIGENAFAESGLTSFSMPMGITKSNNIGNNLLANCKNLTSVDFGKINEINNYMCYACTSLTAITIPSTVTSILTQAFSDCTGLTSIIIPDNVTLMESCFYQCTNLKYVTIGTGLQYFRGTTFMGCSSLVSITIKATTPPEMNNTNSLVNTNNCPIYVPAASVDTYKAASGWSTYADRIYPITQLATVDGNPVYNYEIGNKDATTITDVELEKMPAGTSVEFAEGLTNITAGEINYQQVTLPSTFTGFGDSNQIGSSVTTITSNAVTPPGAFRNQLGGSGLTVINVPASSVDTYKENATWSSFASIIQALPAE